MDEMENAFKIIQFWTGKQILNSHNWNVYVNK